jgi:hypothetical protein
MPDISQYQMTKKTYHISKGDRLYIKRDLLTHSYLRHTAIHKGYFLRQIFVGFLCFHQVRTHCSAIREHVAFCHAILVLFNVFPKLIFNFVAFWRIKIRVLANRAFFVAVFLCGKSLTLLHSSTRQVIRILHIAEISKHHDPSTTHARAHAHTHSCTHTNIASSFSLAYSHLRCDIEWSASSTILLKHIVRLNTDRVQLCFQQGLLFF